MKNILIAGGSGLIGQRLTFLLKEKKYNVAWLSRKIIPGQLCFKWNIEDGSVDNEAIDFADAVINLAGENIAGRRWNDQAKNKIVNSRIQSTNLLYEKFSKREKKLNAFISSSAVGYYGANTSEKIYKESDDAGTDFLANTCRLWEAAASRFEPAGIRTVIIRTGIVLSANGGMLPKMLIPFKYGLGTAFGTGRQYMPWIHLDDLCEMYISAMEKEKFSGAYNAVAPEHLTAEEFNRILAGTLHKPYFIPNIPSWLIKPVLGEMSSLLLEGSVVSAERIISEGFRFKYPDLHSALTEILAD